MSELPELIRILIADDHYVVRRGLATLLVPRNGMEVVGDAATGTEAVELARTLQPDVILMDLIMPQMDGVEAIHRHQAGEPRRPILVLTSFGEREQVAAAVRAGALGLPAQGLLTRRPAVRHSQRLPRQPLYPSGSGQGTDASTLARRRVASTTFTARELECLRLLVQGSVQTGDRRSALYQPDHRALAREQYPPETARRQPHAGRRSGPGAQPGVGGAPARCAAASLHCLRPPTTVGGRSSLGNHPSYCSGSTPTLLC